MLFFTGPISAQTDLSGRWRFQFEVTKATGECAGEEGEVATDIVSVTHDLASGAVTLVWMEGFFEISSEGEVRDNELTYSVIFPQDGGWNNRRVVATINDKNHLSGSEAWAWGHSMESQDACPDSAATFEAWRLPENQEQVVIPKLRSFGTEFAFLMRATAEGRRLLDLYEKHRGEILSIYLTNPLIGGSAVLSMTSIKAEIRKSAESEREEMEETGALIEAYDSVKGSFGAVLANTGSGPVINQGMVDRIANLSNSLMEQASVELANDLQAESNRLNGYQDLLGFGVSELAEELGIDLMSVGMKIFDSSLQEGVFHVEVGYVEGLVFELWKSQSLEEGGWSRLEGAEIVVRDGRVVLSDPAPGSGKSFYRVLRVQPD